MLFNMAGYQVVFSILDNMATQKLDARLDAGDYTEESLVEIRVPLNMPYQDRVTAFERHYGEITIEGKAYTYVKMRIDKDMLVLKCIANSGKQQLKNTTDNLVKSNTGQDMENTGKKNTASPNKVFSNDYDDKNHCWVLPIKESLSTLYFPDHSTPLQDVLIKIPHQPPEC